MRRQASSGRNHPTPAPAPVPARNPAQIQPLEPRQLLSITADALIADGFVKIPWQGQEVFARPGQWIMQVDQMRGTARAQLDAVNQMLAQIRGDARATRQLGQDGLFLVTTAKGVGYGDLQRSLAGAGGLRGMRSLEPDFALWADGTVANDPSFSSQWALNNTGQTGGTADADIDAPEAWSLGQGNGSVVVGVIDTGIDYTHPDLAANVWKNPGEIAGNGVDDDGNGYVDDVYGWDFFNNDNDPMDDNGHGTHVSGTIAAVGNNGVGVTGVNWNAKVMALKFLGADGSGSTSAAIAALDYAAKMRNTYGINIRVTNNSWSGGGYSSSLYSAISANASAGILFVAAAGNGGSDQVGDNNDTTPAYPASYDLGNIVAVAATDNRDALASFSNYGASSVDLAAPGVSILSTTRGGGYGYMSGTSMATPHVSGVAALAWSQYPSASYSAIRDGLLKGVDARVGLSGKVATGGRLNAYGTLGYLQQTFVAPAAPGNLAAAALSSSEVDLSWTDNSGNETGFAILRSADGVSFAQVATVGTGVTRYSDTTVQGSSSYSYLVRAYNAVGVSADSNIAAITTPAAPIVPTAPAAPSSLKAQAISMTQITLSWTDNAANEDGFRIERSTNGAKWSQVAMVGKDATTFTDAGLKKGTTYYYRIRAYNAVGNSAYSNTASARTLSSGVQVARVSSAAVFSSTLIDPAAQANSLLEDGYALL